MAEPNNSLVPEDIDPAELEGLEEPEFEEVVTEDQPQEPSRLDQLKDYGKEKFQEAREQRREAKEQEQLRTDESKKPPQQQPEQPTENPELSQRRQAKAQEAVDRVKSGEQKLQKATGQGTKAAGKELAGAAEKEAAVAAKQGARAAAKATGKAAGQAAKAAGRATAQAARAAIAATSEVWGPALIIILIIVVILAIVFVFFSLGRGTGKGIPQYPETAYDQEQIVSLLAVSNDINSTREKVLTEVNSMEARLNTLKNRASSIYSTTKAKSAQADIDAVIEQINLLKPVAGDPAQRQVVLEKINDQLESISNKYPELLFNVGNCAELQKYIDAGRFSIARSPERTTIAKGYLVRGGHSQITRAEQGSIQINPKLCNISLFILENGFDIGGLTLTYGHRKYSSGTTKSQHFVGEAVDISIINGSAISSSQGTSRAKTLMSLLRNNYQKLGIWELWGPSNQSVDNCKTTSRTISGHNNHIHIGMTNPDTEKQCR